MLPLREAAARSNEKKKSKKERKILDLKCTLGFILETATDGREGEPVTYTISAAARRMGVSVPTLRYYDKEGLLPFVDRKPNGIRVFKDSDFEWLAVINCMKNAGASIKEIKAYIDLCMAGDDTLEARLAIFRRRKEEIQRQMQELQKLMGVIDHKIWYYQTAIEAGTESVHEGLCYNMEELLK